MHALTPALPLLRAVGGPGSRANLGQTPQLSGPMWLAAAPWSNTNVLVPDSGNSRVVEVDVVNGTLVRVWVSGIGGPRGVAASSTVIAVSQENTTSSRVLVYSVQSGALLATIGGAPLTTGSTCCAGVQLGLPSGLRLSQDGTTMDVAEAGAGRVTRWRVADGAYLATVGPGYSQPLDVQQCVSTASGSVGAVVASSNGSSVDVAVDGALLSASGVVAGSPGSVALVPGLGMAVVLQASSRLVLLSSVVMSTQPASSSLIAGSSITLSVAVSGAASGVTYEWTRNGSVVGGNSSWYTLVSDGSDGGAVYAVACSAVHALGRAVSSVAYVSVYAQVCAAQKCPL